jgi:hypothetical protein
MLHFTPELILLKTVVQKLQTYAQVTIKIFLNITVTYHGLPLLQSCCLLWREELWSPLGSQFVQDSSYAYMDLMPQAVQVLEWFHAYMYIQVN